MLACTSGSHNTPVTRTLRPAGLSRDLDDTMYYESEGGMVPIRWTPPEAYKFKRYSPASDVWSYGITLCVLIMHALCCRS
jgi:serine/threonine protein kinase